MVYITEGKTDGMENPLGTDNPIPVFTWIFQSEERNKKQSACQIQIASTVELLEKGMSDIWDSGKVVTDAQKLAYAGNALEENCLYYWHVRIWDEAGDCSMFSNVYTFETAFFDTRHFFAKWIAASKPMSDTLGKGMFVGREDEMQPRTILGSLPVFSGTFRLELEKKIRRARAYVSGLGVYDMKINGQRVTENWFEPGESDYSKEIFYVTYDITELIKNGNNAVGAVLGKGYYLEEGDGKYKKLYPNYGELMFKAQLLIEYEDGTKQTVITDESFYCYEEGPFQMSSWTGGEDYDATRESGDWSIPGFDYAEWKPVRIVQPAAEKIMAKYYPAVGVAETFPAVSCEEVETSVYLVDFGRNFAGVYRFSLEAERGTVIQLWPSELLENGRITQCSTGTPIWDSYTFRGGEREVWSPRFCYHGFRYLEVRVVSGKLKKPSAEQFEAFLLCCRNEKTGEFSCSDEAYCSIHKITMRSIEANMFNTMTDCPHREKLGWQEVPHLMFDSIAYNYDIQNFQKKIANDTVTAQHVSGLVPDICPEFVRFSDGFLDDPTWGGSCIFIPYFIYLTYGDESQLYRSYKCMKKYMQYLYGKSENSLLNHGLGDWGAYDTSTPLSLVVSCTYYALARTMCEIAALTGREQDCEEYTCLAGKIRQAVNQRFFCKETGIYGSGSQASQALPLFYGIVETTYTQSVLQQLIEAVKREEYHITTGEIALKPLIEVLSGYGYMDVVLKLLMNRTMPGYLYFVEHHATTLPEYWDMKASQLHCMMGHVEGWFYRWLAGIRSTSPGFRTFDICPYFPENMTHLTVRVKTVYGAVSLQWKKEKDQTIAVEIDIPCNTEAEFFVSDNSYFICRQEKTEKEKVEKHRYRFGSGRYKIRLCKKYFKQSIGGRSIYEQEQKEHCVNRCI